MKRKEPVSLYDPEPGDPPNMPRADRRKSNRLLKEHEQQQTMIEKLKQLLHPSKVKPVNDHVRAWINCQDCKLGQCALVQNHVFWRGRIPCDVLFVGEAPWISEDTFGRPFAGPTGETMQQIIDDSSFYAFKSDQLSWCITNVVCCMPYPDSGEEFKPRPPTPNEIDACVPRLHEFIELVEPKLIVAVGSVAEKTFKTYDLTRLPVVHVFHPSWVDRQKDKVLEVKRIATYLADVYRKVPLMTKDCQNVEARNQSESRPEFRNRGHR